MIKYNSHNWKTLFKINGSVFPKASCVAVCIATISLVLKFLEEQGHISFNKYQIITDSTAYQGFTFTLGFVLVFRTSQCYNRFWGAATSICTMRAQFFEASSSLCSFVLMSKKDRHEIEVFKHRIIRLFSLLHATALEDIADLRDENFPVIDIESLCQKSIMKLQSMQGRCKVELVYSWVNALIVESLSTGLLNVPPPILSRVFQEMEKGMVEYNQVLQIMDIPFPFPYAQVSVVLLIIYFMFTPVVMCYWTNSSIFAFLFTLIAIMCMCSIELIAAELENPFGDDPNDLPCFAFQEDMNAGLLLCLDPATELVPELLPTARFSYEELRSVKQFKSYVQVLQELKIKEAEEQDNPELTPQPVQPGNMGSSSAPQMSTVIPVAPVAGAEQPSVAHPKSQASRDATSVKISGGQQALQSTKVMSGPPQVTTTTEAVQKSPQQKDTSGESPSKLGQGGVGDPAWSQRLITQQDALHHELRQVLDKIVRRLNQPLMVQPCHSYEREGTITEPTTHDAELDVYERAEPTNAPTCCAGVYLQPNRAIRAV